MTRFLLILLLLGSPAMAKDGGILAPNRPNQSQTSEEEFWASEQGQDIERLFSEFSAGTKTYDEVFDEYHKKWSGRPSAPPTAQSPDAPFLPVR